jgi:hypothetical protein
LSEVENPSEGGDPVGKYRSVSVTYGHACAIPKGEKHVECWIPSKLRGAIVSAPSGKYRTIKTTFYGVCGLTYDGKINCLGATYEDVEPLQGEFVEMSVGGEAVCGIDTGGRVHCSAEEDSVATDTPDGVYESIDVGAGYACALDTEGRVTCWGDGHGRFDGLLSDVPEGRFKSLAVGDQHACALTANYKVHCWGRNDYGQASPPDAVRRTP